MTTPRTQHPSEKQAKPAKSEKPVNKTAAKAEHDAIALLKADHRRVETLFAEYESAKKPEQRSELVHAICNELTLHAALEESQFYPVARDALGEDADLVDEAEVEHGSLKWLIHQLQTEAENTDQYAAKVFVLKEYVSHHVKEEEKKLFPKVKQSSIDTAELGETMVSAKTELQKKLKLN